MFKIGSLTLKSPIIQSPMVGCTDLAYRLVARRRGLPFCFVEMLSANAMMHESRKTAELMKTVEADRPLGAQIMGCDPDIMAAAAQKVEQAGFDLVDINMGCPVRKVTANGAGAALLKDPKKTEAIFKKVVAAVKRIPVTIKIRKGYEDESGAEAVEIAKVAQACGITAITVHGRTRAQGYTGRSDWEAIGKVKRAVTIPVIGNGDVLTPADARRLRDISGCDGVMIGRGALGNPWLFQQIHSALFENKELDPPTMSERLSTVLEHMEEEAKWEGDQRAVYHMRRIGSWYIAGIHNAAHWRDQLTRSRSLQDVGDILTEALSNAKDFMTVTPTMTEGQ